MALDNFRTIELIWDKANKSIIKTIKTASSDTTGRYFSVKVLDEGQEVDLTGAKLQLYWEHPNFNTNGTDDFTTVDTKGKFTLTFSEEMLTNIGELNAYLILTLTDGKITSDGFPIQVFKGADDGVVVPTNGAGLVKQIDGKIDKGNVTLNDLTQDVKLAMTGGAVAVVGENAVGTENVKDSAITPDKISKIGNRVNYFNKDNVMTNQFYAGSVGNKAYISTSSTYSSPTQPIPVKVGDIVRFNFARFTSYFVGVDDDDIVRQVPTDVGGTKTSVTVTVNAGVTKFYTASHNNDLGTAMITINKEMPEKHYGYNDQEKTKISWIEVDSENLAKEYQGLKWVAFGDSLTEANSRTTKNYHGYVADDLGLSVTNMGVGGTGYKRTSESDTAFYQRISSVPLDTDIITIFGSLNDLGAGVPIGTASDTGTDTLGGAINTTLDNLNSRLPVAPVGIISPTPWQTSKPWDDSNSATQYAKLLKDICDDRGLPFLDLYHNSGLRPWDANYRTRMYSRDDGNGTHPDEKGHKLFYPQVREFIKRLI